jgi:hypothetical protein
MTGRRVAGFVKFGGGVAERVVRISVDAELRDRYWLFAGGTLELEFRAPSTRSILLDLSKLTWADPVPLLTLSCLCAEFRSRGGRLEIELGRPNHANLQFRIFFAQHGFLATIAPDSVVRWSGQRFLPHEHGELEQRLRALAGALAYQDAECIPAQLVPTNGLTPTKLDQLVENLIDVAHPRISSWLYDNSRRRGLMLHQLRVLLTEALDNVKEHAYRDYGGYGAIYARIRAGRPEEPGAYRAWTQAKSREEYHCPTLERCRAGRRPGWLELFICDAGVGITHDHQGDAKAPLQVLSTKLFEEAVSRISDRESAGKTNMTGLQRIGQLLLAGRAENNRGDFVRVYSNGEWVGEHLPWPKAGETLPGLRNVIRVTDAVQPSGTVLHIALEPPPETAAEQAKVYPNAFYAPDFSDLSAVRRELALERSRIFDGVALFDIYRAENQRFAHQLESLPYAARGDQSTLVVRPSRVQRKVDLVGLIRAFLKPDATVTDLIFADVPWASAIDFHNIITSEKTWRESGSGEKFKIHILSQDWFCATLQFNSQSRCFETSVEAAQRFVAAPCEKSSAAQAAGMLRRQDSLLFWNKAEAAYLNEPVRWRTGSEDATETIWGYFDLNFALAQPDVHEIARRAIRRSVSAFVTHSVHAADEIVARVLGSDFDLGTPHPGQAAVEPTVLAGSVLGSGNTLRRFQRGGASDYRGVLQMLHHPDFARTSTDELLALDWLPPSPKGKRSRPPTFERVANTPFVLRGGESAVPLARFSRPHPDKPRRSLYGETPNEAYQRWQRLGLLRMGHWMYGTNHDLLTLRLGDALVYDAAEGGSLVGWLAHRLREWIDVKINSDGIAIATGFVVYAQHSVTAELVRALSRHPLCMDIPFYPAATASAQGRAALVFSPMTREALVGIGRGRLRLGGSAVILDDAVVSGATMRSIRQAIGGLWEALRDVGRIAPEAELKIHTLAIVDRSGEPAQRALVERNLEADRRFWRWDVPSLGHGGACVLCSLHARWQALGSAVHGALLKDRLEQWLKQWGATPVEIGRFDAGIPARRLPETSSTRFGIERIGKVEHRVTHSLSVSRVSIAAEIAGATTRKDYPLRKARHALASSTNIDVETALEILSSQLLLFQDGLSSSDRAERLELMLELLWSHPEATITTALAGMTMLIDQSLVSATWERCIELIERRGFPNLDALLTALALFHMAGKDASRPLRLGTPWEIFDLCRRSSHEDRDALAMVLRVFGWSQNSMHRSTLVDRLDSAKMSLPALPQTILMMERLADAFEGLPLLAVDGSSLKPRSDSAALRELTGSISSRYQVILAHDEESASQDDYRRLRASLDEAWSMLFAANCLHALYRRQLCASLTGQDAADKILIPAWRVVVERWDKFVGEKGEAMVERWPDLPIVWFEPADGASKLVDLYYDSTIRCAVADLMSNVVHSNQSIGCPWPEGSDIPSADLWGRVRVAPDGASATIELVNGYSGNGDIHPHVSANLVHLYAMGGKTSVEPDSNSGLIFTTITLPTAAGVTGS